MQQDLIGQRIREMRKQQGLTQEQLATEIYISESYMTLIEQGKRSMSINILAKIANRLGVTTDYLINGNELNINETLYKEWLHIIDGRSMVEIKASINVIKEFFSCLDGMKKG